MYARLICTACGAALSDGIEIRSTKDPSTPHPVFEDQAPLTPPGQGIKSWEPIQQSLTPADPADLEFAPQFWLNPTDVDETVEPVKDHSRLSGCCGYSGCGGPNMQCKICRAEVGTRQSDCWTPDVFIPEPNATRWIETEQ